MKNQFLLVLLATAGIALPTPALADSEENPQLNFLCQVNEGITTTVVQSPSEKSQIPIFHWKPEALANRTSENPEELCNMVTQKLADYSVDYDLSSINFIGTTQDQLPAICANAGGPECSKVLFTLDRPKNETASVVAANVVDSILDKNLQPKKTELRTRGVQSISYQVDFWSLLGLKFSNKY